MPFNKADDCAGGDVSKDYCKYCGDEKGIHSYDKLVEGMTGYIAKTEKVDDKTAKEKAVEWVKGCEAYKQGRIKE